MISIICMPAVLFSEESSQVSYTVLQSEKSCLKMNPFSKEPQKRYTKFILRIRRRICEPITTHKRVSQLLN